MQVHDILDIVKLVIEVEYHRHRFKSLLLKLKRK
jgi:hypothetical protein